MVTRCYYCNSRNSATIIATGITYSNSDICKIGDGTGCPIIVPYEIQQGLQLGHTVSTTTMAIIIIIIGDGHV